jgi:hypothetical protein
MRTVIGYFDDYDGAEAAVAALRKAGYSRDSVSLIARDPSAERAPKQAAADQDGEAVAGGATTGAVIGGALGIAVGLGALVIPGIGPVLAAGPLIAGLAGGAAGAAAGGAAGGLVGVLVDAGVSHDQADDYAEGVRRGGAIVTLGGLDAAEAIRVEDILQDAGAEDIAERATRWRGGGRVREAEVG